MQNRIHPEKWHYEEKRDFCMKKIIKDLWSAQFWRHFCAVKVLLKASFS